jgi:DNA-binding transcriptional MerR regulator
MADLYTISELAREVDITTRTIRFYEDEGLLQPGRNGRQRIYARRDYIRLKLILRGKRLGLSLSEISDIIELYDSDQGETGQLASFLDSIRERRTVLKQQRTDIDATLHELQRIERRCRARLKTLS